MKVALVKHDNFVCDESSTGLTAIKKLPCQIFLAGSYCRSIGMQAEVFNLRRLQKFPLEDYDVIVSWVPLYEEFYKAVKYLKAAKDKGKITVMVMNDPLDGLEMEAMQRFLYIDYCIKLYEREYTLGYLLKELENGNKDYFPAGSGLIYRKGDVLIDTGKRPALTDLKHLPSTAEFLKNEPIQDYREVFIEAGRGCPFGCTFCFYNRTPPRKRDFKDIISELRVLEGKKAHVWLHDLNMLVNEEWVNGLCDAIIKSRVDVRWGTDARVDECSNLALLKKMKRAGCHLLVFGIESADPLILNKIDKRIDFQLLDKALKNCKEADIKAELNIMYGFPWDDRATMQKTEDFIKKYPVSCIMLVRPLRGTPLYDEYKRLGLIKKDMVLEDYISSKKYPSHPTLYLTREEVYGWHRRFEGLASRYSLKRKIGEEGALRAYFGWIKLKGLRIFNPRKIFEHFSIK